MPKPNRLRDLELMLLKEFEAFPPANKKWTPTKKAAMYTKHAQTLTQWQVEHLTQRYLNQLKQHRKESGKKLPKDLEAALKMFIEYMRVALPVLY